MGAEMDDRLVRRAESVAVLAAMLRPPKPHWMRVAPK
jgi:hypothetical protein